MKRSIASILTLMLVVAMAGLAQAADKPIVLKISNQVTDTSALNLSLVEMGKILEQKSGGTMKLEVYPSGQLGSNRELLEQLQSGLLEMLAPSMAPISGFNKTGEFLDLPFLFKDEASAERILDGEVGDKIFAELEKSNFVGLAWWTQGWRHMTTKDREVHGPADMKGLKIRVMENPIYISFFKALGASPVPIAYSEILSSLQQGVVDGQENPYMNIKLSGFYEVQKYIIETAHVYDPIPILVSKPIWDQLTDQQKQWLKEATIEGRDIEREMTRKMDAEIKAELQKSGKNVVIDLAPEQRAQFRTAVEPVYTEWAPKYNGLVERVVELQK